MGVQILNKDVSLISQILGKAKASISNVMGTTGWSGGGTDVTLNPTPNWNDPVSWPTPTTNAVEMQGINVPVDIYYACNFCGDGGQVEIDTNGGGFIPVGEYEAYTVFPGDLITFRVVDLVFSGTQIIDVYNGSDGDAFLDQITFLADVP